jgi:hypothetical protein
LDAYDKFANRSVIPGEDDDEDDEEEEEEEEEEDEEVCVWISPKLCSRESVFAHSLSVHYCLQDEE